MYEDKGWLITYSVSSKSTCVGWMKLHYVLLCSSVWNVKPHMIFQVRVTVHH